MQYLRFRGNIMTKRLRKEPSLNPKKSPPPKASMGGAEMKRQMRRRRNTAMGPKGTKRMEPTMKSEPPTLTKKAGPPKKGHRYERAGLSTYHKGERAIANAENQKKRTGPKISKIRKAFARVPLAAFRLGGGGGGGAGRK